MYIAIVGSRTFKDKGNIIKAGLDALLPGFFDEVVVISGEAKGADILAKEYAIKNGYEYQGYPAKWDDTKRVGAVVEKREDGTEYDKAAGMVRNLDMARDCDACIAFWDMKSKGTRNMIDNVLRYDKPIYVVDNDGVLYRVLCYHPDTYFSFDTLQNLMES